ncbi:MULTISPECIES: diguanylate cyclase [unclassified Pseudomonas]|uniref:GGDEF domain-containing protein n=1 Tax=unclassified Pseudomonas TaxID=196821 RepID=UPI00088BD839|nr:MULTISPECIES: diguanylate cyclase [unclassified Pseudomonas]SCX91608.1 diguanylate cyclase (GGDEF) domain-containing protein [Pseudomonas sp. NFACC37-1]SFN74980.1 diguanylate cyclase (GGDEF) domain-containing protein [Pseudomonas sp. NFACC24-1]
MGDSFRTAASQPPPTKAFSSLGRRLVLATLLFCLFFTLAMVTWRTWLAWENNLAEMNSELALIDQVFQNTLAYAIWELDRESLDQQITSVAAAAPVGRVVLNILRPGQAPEVIELNRYAVGQSGVVPVLHRQLIAEPYAGAHEKVGELTIEGDNNLLWERLWSEARSIVITQLIQSLLLAGLVMTMFNRLVTVHVVHIARHLGELAPHTLKHHLKLQRAVNRQDELSLLEFQVNELQDNLYAHLERQHSDELALAASRDQMAELVEARTAELKAANQSLEALSRHDALTGLANRRYFDELKEIEFRRAIRHNTPLAVLMCDVDFFKIYNDTYGHMQGDLCLKEIAETLRSVFGRSGELTARVGGEEFVVVLPNVDAAQACQAAQRFRTSLAERELPHSGSKVSPFVTVSIGVAELDPETMDHFDQLLQRADQALYRAKHQGRDRVAL